MFYRAKRYKYQGNTAVYSSIGFVSTAGSDSPSRYQRGKSTDRIDRCSIYHTKQQKTACSAKELPTTFRVATQRIVRHPRGTLLLVLLHGHTTPRHELDHTDLPTDLDHQVGIASARRVHYCALSQANNSPEICSVTKPSFRGRTTNTWVLQVVLMFLQGFSRVMIRPAGWVRRCSKTRGSSRVGSGDLECHGTGRVGPEVFPISRGGSSHPDSI